jgi:hypothetical protein
MNQFVVLITVLILLVTGCSGQQGARGPWSGPGSGALTSGRGPGLHSPGSRPLDLAVPPTYDLSHVEPANVAAALGNDHLKIFEYVRDYIGYEPIVTQYGYGFEAVMIGSTRLQMFALLARIVWGLLRSGARFGGFGNPPFNPLPR